jgi:hypothetical protein
MNAHQQLDAFKPEKVEEVIGTLPIPRATIADIVAHRNKALALYAEAFVIIEAADKAIKAAASEATRCHPGTNSYNYAHADETTAFFRAVQLPDRAQYLRTAKKIIDIVHGPGSSSAPIWNASWITRQSRRCAIRWPTFPTASIHTPSS